VNPHSTIATEQPATADPARIGRRSLLRLSVALGVLGLPVGRSAAAGAKATKTTTKKTTTKKATTATTTAPTTTAKATATAAGTPFNEKLELAVAFTFATPDGRARNPYVAVWIEDAAGTSVRTIDLSIQLGKGLEYLKHLTRWDNADRTRMSKGGADLVETISSATRVAGSYEVVWDGRDDAGKILPQGAYMLYVEGAREHGPYELVKGEIAVESAPFSKTLGSNGELQNVTAKLRART
jgi:hypothetical protein